MSPTRAGTATCLMAVAIAGCGPVTPRLSPSQPAALPGLVPRPSLVRPGVGGPFTVTDDTVIVVPAGDERAGFVGQFLTNLIATGALAAPRVAAGEVQPPRGSISLTIDRGLGPERYLLSVATPAYGFAAVAGVTRRDQRAWPDFAVRLGAQSRPWSALGIDFYGSPDVPWQP